MVRKPMGGIDGKWTKEYKRFGTQTQRYAASQSDWPILLHDDHQHPPPPRCNTLVWSSDDKTRHGPVGRIGTTCRRAMQALRCVRGQALSERAWALASGEGVRDCW